MEGFRDRKDSTWRNSPASICDQSVFDWGMVLERRFGTVGDPREDQQVATTNLLSWDSALRAGRELDCLTAIQYRCQLPEGSNSSKALRQVDLLEINSSESVRRAQNSPARILHKYLSAFQDVHGRHHVCYRGLKV
jgi:hypothetical protein